MCDMAKSSLQLVKKCYANIVFFMFQSSNCFFHSFMNNSQWMEKLEGIAYISFFHQLMSGLLWIDLHFAGCTAIAYRMPSTPMWPAHQSIDMMCQEHIHNRFIMFSHGKNKIWNRTLSSGREEWQVGHYRTCLKANVLCVWFCSYIGPFTLAKTKIQKTWVFCCTVYTARKTHNIRGFWHE